MCVDEKIVPKLWNATVQYPPFLLGLPPFTRARRENPNPLTCLVEFE